jgi:hypothetical protein
VTADTKLKMSATHMAYWELYPMIDHVIPIARGGVNHESNWVTTSALRNSAKANWSIEELGWTLRQPGDFKHWDGLLSWFFQITEQEPSHLKDKYVRNWHRAALRVVVKVERP